MDTSAGISRTPFECMVSAHACQCKGPRTQLGRTSTLDNAIARIEGYWNVYLAFFGDQSVWLTWQVVDLRDGTIMWRNGRRTTPGENNHGKGSEQDGDGGSGRGGSRVGKPTRRRGSVDW